MLNYTSRPGDVLTMAHELGHGVHAALARPQGIFQFSTPLTVAETASIFGETIVLERLLERRARRRRAALAARRVARRRRRRGLPPGGDEPLRGPRPRRAPRRRASSRSTRFAAAWLDTQADLLGDSVELADGLRHLVVLRAALHRHARLRLRLRLRAPARALGLPPLRGERRRVRRRPTSSCCAPAARCSPEELGAIVGVDLTDPGFWTLGPRPDRAPARGGRGGRGRGRGRARAGARARRYPAGSSGARVPRPRRMPPAPRARRR